MNKTNHFLPSDAAEAGNKQYMATRTVSVQAETLAQDGLANSLSQPAMHLSQHSQQLPGPSALKETSKPRANSLPMRGGGGGGEGSGYGGGGNVAAAGPFEAQALVNAQNQKATALKFLLGIEVWVLCVR